MRGLLPFLALSVTACPAREAPPSHRAAASVVVHSGSRVKDGVVRPGGVTRSTAATRASAAANAAMASMGDLAPPRVVIHIDLDIVDGPPIDRIETADDGFILLATDETLPIGVWVHELTHVRLRPRAAAPNIVTRRLRDAAEEGVADYIARSLALELPARANRSPTSARFEALAFAKVRFDPHPLGERLAAALAIAEVPPVVLVESLAASYSHPAATPQIMMDAWVAACPPAARPRLVAALEAWLPRELYVAKGRGSR